MDFNVEDVLMIDRLAFFADDVAATVQDDDAKKLLDNLCALAKQTTTRAQLVCCEECFEIIDPTSGIEPDYVRLADAMNRWPAPDWGDLDDCQINNVIGWLVMVSETVFHDYWFLGDLECESEEASNSAQWNTSFYNFISQIKSELQYVFAEPIVDHWSFIAPKSPTEVE